MADDLLTTIRAELAARLRELEPAVAEYERLSSLADTLLPPDPPARTPSTAPRAPHRASRGAPRKRGRPVQSATGGAIVAALEHGSHTLAELVVVTALPAPVIRDDLRRLRQGRAIVRIEREGKAAYALPDPTTA